MATVTTVCPHCGKSLSSPDKLGWHLSRECPALLSITQAEAALQTGGKSAQGDRR